MNDRKYPDSLKPLPIWALWRLEADNKNRLTKVPYSPKNNGRASSTNPLTWGTFNQAVQKFESRSNYYNGISLIISKDYGLVFIDIDHCSEPEGTWSETACDIVGAFQHSYIERSQSGTGIHIITKGTIPKSFKNSQNNVEMYNDKRFCALTGDVLSDGEPTEEPSSLEYVYQKYKPPEKVTQRVREVSCELKREDKWILNHASGHGRFDDLFSGQWSSFYGSQSEADLSLCLILAFWTDCNIDQIDRIFRSSGLYRQKWDREDYRTKTLQNAVNQCRETLSEYIRRKDLEGGDRLERALCEVWDRQV